MQLSAVDSSDEALVLEMVRGERDALAALYDRHAGVVFGLARRVLRDEGRAEEVAQDVFLAAWRGAATYDPARASVLTWLVTMTRSRALDLLRADRARPRRTDHPVEESRRAATIADEHVDSDPVEAASLHGRADVVRAAVARLPRAQREAIELAYFGGLSQSEVAERLGEPLGTIKTRTFHGMRTLRALLDEAGVRDA